MLPISALIEVQSHLTWIIFPSAAKTFAFNLLSAPPIHIDAPKRFTVAILTWRSRRVLNFDSASSKSFQFMCFAAAMPYSGSFEKKRNNAASTLDEVSALVASTRSGSRSLTMALAESHEDSKAPNVNTNLVLTESSRSRSGEESRASMSFLAAAATSVSSRCWERIQ